eukprot:CAMPEP_0182934602 /NCGR_PEP_ID=MMETSP0105_2-20130417/36432_1 /TAXON_ID=81532 ORGANISM="Acanthoeca-like sp., Strain 10tr" /NCGR_SAMPLE_ID=MMETSP0105_2 /ASSEMBLY_ACC=CAM_ASM_000205 /LENGTH=124 /DNA_ID=CAMNT_0025073467 /DNA_START=228 /DNA_END=598 /DNA_ORIENTATION=-
MRFASSDNTAGPGTKLVGGLNRSALSAPRVEEKSGALLSGSDDGANNPPLMSSGDLTAVIAAAVSDVAPKNAIPNRLPSAPTPLSSDGTGAAVGTSPVKPSRRDPEDAVAGIVGGSVGDGDGPG